MAMGQNGTRCQEKGAERTASVSTAMAENRGAEKGIFFDRFREPFPPDDI